MSGKAPASPNAAATSPSWGCQVGLAGREGREVGGQSHGHVPEAVHERWRWVIFGAEQGTQILAKRDLRCSPCLDDRSLGGISTRTPTHGQAEVQQNSLQLIMHQVPEVYRQYMPRHYTGGSGCSVG